MYQLNQTHAVQNECMQMMFTRTPSDPYPFGAFHLVTERTAAEISRQIQAPDPLTGLALLTAQAISCQPLIDVRLPTGQVRPVSLNTAGIAESGERKTTIDGLVMHLIHQRDELRAKKYDKDTLEYQAEHRVWSAIEKGICKDITKATQKGEPVEGLRRQLAEHMAKAPVKPRLRRILRQNATERAIMEALQGHGESIALMSDEGGIILNGGPLSRPDNRNKAWDGAPTLVMDRAKSESIVAHHPRMTVSFFVQEAVLRDFLGRRGAVTRGSGHWARYLFAWPISTQGFRFMSYGDVVWKHLPAFHARIAELLDEHDRRIEAGTVERTVIEFSDEAKRSWVDLVNHVEGMLRPDGYLSDIKDFASKAAEIVGRVAAIQHWFSKQEGKISIDTLNRAWAIVEWHLHEFKRIFSPTQVVPQEWVDAQTLEDHLHKRYWCRGFRFVKKNEVLKAGPLRPRSRLDAALDCLIDMGRVRIDIGPKRERYILLNPQYFESIPLPLGGGGRALF